MHSLKNKKLLNLDSIMEQLCQKRPIFHSEADFQHAFAWTLHERYNHYNIRLEKREIVDNKEIYFDVALIIDHKTMPIELKYKTLVEIFPLLFHCKNFILTYYTFCFLNR